METSIYRDNHQNRILDRVGRTYGTSLETVTNVVEKYQIEYDFIGNFVSAVISGKIYYDKETAQLMIIQHQRAEKLMDMEILLPKIRKRIRNTIFGNNMTANYERVYKWISDRGLDIHTYGNFKEQLDKLVRLQAVGN